ncbi:hypothetical protein BABINDRAFT_175612 [Babjeviella inositovora NRRL Y-12698]|uniref:Uncharacterized protein n=1 Tax=Babjeviella inositovora NRRL Y-12698 TaxID=984486 RepID=A0A1E3QR51_9ASCO|nr:uncharacterized protein BABINDRAFT_175612 [Babjeviella inositovora NRRL Y-12698]ODQ80183.1 hypothetical protein BABINDRAFT_175612 [Babjeviella inositovora NRRL Y-12698]
MESLFDLQRNYLLLAITSVRSANGYKCYLVLDAKTEGLVSALLSTNELREHVFAVERVDQPRALNLTYEAIYILDPNELSVNCLVTDYKYQPLRYKCGHVFLLPGVSDALQSKIHNQERAQSYLHGVGTLHWTLRAYEAQIFTVPDTTKALQVFHNENCVGLVSQYVSRSVEALVNLCVVTGEYPLVRHYAPAGATHKSAVLCQLIARAFQDAIDTYARATPDFPPESARARAQLIIVDRSVDYFAPLLHEFTYQAMVHDVVPLVDETYTYTDSVGKKKKYVLTDSDAQWRQLRHLHLLDSGAKIKANMARFLRENPNFYEKRDADKVRISEVAQQFLQKDRVFAEEREIYLHSKLIQDCGEINNARRLAELAIVEQDCAAFGVSREGDKLKRIIDDALPLLADACPTHTDKFRTIAVYALYRGGLVHADFEKLFTFAGCWKPEQFAGLFRILANLELLGAQVIKPDVKSKGFKKQMFHYMENTDPYDSSRFRPALETIVAQALANQLDEETFPYFRDKPIEDVAAPGIATLRQHKAVWAKGSQYLPPKQRVFYFVAGGVTFSEMRSCYDLSAKLDKEIYLGSNEVLSPLMYLEALRELSLARERLQLPVDKEVDTRAPEFLVKRGDKPRADPRAEPRADPKAEPKAEPRVRVQSLKATSLSPTPSPQLGKEEKEDKKRSRFKKLFK